MRNVLWWGPAALALGLGCGGGGVADDDDTGDAADAVDGTGDVPGDAFIEDGREVPLSCGDGIRDPEEECDRGDLNSDTEPDACRTDCRRARCGDGVVDSGEACDDGNDDEEDGCLSTCRLTTCGNGTVDPGEACDDGDDDNTNDCLDTCVAPSCGDGHVWAGHESCDGPDPLPCTTVCGSTGLRACVDCGLGGDCVPPSEICNGMDDDCDAEVDETFACAFGATVSCVTPCGSTGAGPCTAECTAPSGAACTPPSEICNGLDDDCDTVADDGLPCVPGVPVACTTRCGSTGAGVCTVDCGFPAPADCLPPLEACNGLDDDCDTVADNGFACVRGAPVACVSACGTTGTGVCTDACAIPAPVDCLPPREVCNGGDDDCDTVADNGFACVRGLTGLCTVGACSGTRICGDTCVWGACNFGAPPPNNACPGAGGAPTDLPSAVGSHVVRGNTCAAANSFPYTCGGVSAGSPDLVYRLVLTESRVVTLDTIGSTFDAMLFLRSGNACPGAELACDDNGAGGTPGQARIARTLAPGTYWVIVDGAGVAARGPFALNVQIGDAGVRPVNDPCSGAIALVPDAVLRSVTGDTSLGTDDNVSCRTAPGEAAPDLWYRFTLAVPSAVYLSTQDGGTWDSVIHVRRDSCTGSLTAIGCADDACGSYRSQFAGILPAGTYFVAVDGYQTTSAGPFTLYYQASTCVAAVDADPATTAVVDPIRAAGTWYGRTVGQGDDSRGSCVPPTGAAIPDVYYWTVLCPGRTTTASTCNATTDFDTSLYARYGQCLGGDAPDTACNDNESSSIACPYYPPGTAASSIQFGATGQGIYYLWVDGAAGSSGGLPVQGNYGLVLSGF